MRYFVLLCVFLVGHKELSQCADTTPQPKIQRIYIDTLVGQYLTTEKDLWKKIETKQILVDRGDFLSEIYRTHNRTLNNDFGDTKSIWSLGIQRNEKLINNILAIETNAKNIKEYLTRGEYPKVAELAKNAIDQMEKSAADFYQTISDKSFWENILSNHVSAQCNKQLANVRNGNELIFDIHKELGAVLLKGYINVQLAHMILKVTEEATSKQKPDDYRKSFREQYAAIQSSTKDVLKKADNKIFMCDKGNFPVSYHQITRFIQGYVDNEVNLNPDESCRKTCSDYTRTKNHGCYSDTLCAATHIDQASTRCNGTVLNCEFIAEDLTACPSSQKLETRRYDFIRYMNGKAFGKLDSCLQSAQASSWTSWFVQCSNCFCYCDEQSHLSDRYFSLHDVIANINENRIVTGVSIIKQNRMITLVIAESTLLPFGKVNTTIKNDDSDMQNNRYVRHPEFQVDGAGVKNGIDFHTLTYENRAINLDTVIAPAGKLVTGIRFHLTDDFRLTLQIRVTDFNYETGRLEQIEKSAWVSSAENARNQLILDHPDVPTRTPLPQVANWTPNQFIKFGPTDRVKDAGQLTVPFLDGTFVEGNPTLVAGIGFYHKGQSGYGGFIAPYLVTYDFASLIQPLDAEKL